MNISVKVTCSEVPVNKLKLIGTGRDTNCFISLSLFEVNWKSGGSHLSQLSLLDLESPEVSIKLNSLFIIIPHPCIESKVESIIY